MVLAAQAIPGEPRRTLLSIEVLRLLCRIASTDGFIICNLSPTVCFYLSACVRTEFLLLII